MIYSGGVSGEWKSWAPQDKAKLYRTLLLEESQYLYTSPGLLAPVIDPTISVQTPALDILDQALIDAESGKQPWLIFSMPPQEGKSERVSRIFPIWCLMRNPMRRIAIASYADDIAMRWGRQIRDDITANPELGLALHPGISAAKEWRLDGFKGGVITAGMGGALTGRAVDVMIIDDPLKDREEAESPTMRQRCINFWKSKASTRLPESSIVVLIMTRWHEEDLAGYLATEHAQDFRLINIPAQAEHQDGKSDCKCAGNGTCLGREVLGREPGQYMISARKRTEKGWELRKRSAGAYDWAALYQGHPSPAEGGIFKTAWWRINEIDRAVERGDGSWFVPGADEVMISVDCSFKDLKDSDYVAIGVFARRGARMEVLDMDFDRMEFTETCRRLLLMVAKWPQATLRLIEDKANGPAVISAMRHKIGGLVPYTPVDSKLARARACSPFVEAGNIGVPNPQRYPWVAKFLHQCAAFPNAANDDMVDSFTQACIRLLGSGQKELIEEMMEELGISYTDAFTAATIDGLAERREIEATKAWNPQHPERSDADPDDEPWR